MSFGTYLLLYVLAFLWDGVYTIYCRAIAKDSRLLAISTSALMPLIGLVELVCLIEAPGILERVMVGVVTAAGCATATALVMYWPRRESG